ncbi:MAG: beta-galactosidase [Paenibacillus sp.]|nr:beta-galactosidase [Paenibacillus sp.]
MIYGAAYYPEQNEPGKWAHDLDYMKMAGMNAVRVGEFAWKRLEPCDGEYDFAWLDAFTDMAGEREIRLLLCSPLRTVPAWLVERHPDLLIETDEGVQLEYGSRYTFCINNPALRAKGFALAERLAKHYGGSPLVLGWHLDNEYGDEPDCHCLICKQEWQLWLERRYGTIGRLNEAWGTVFWGLEFDAFRQVPTLRKSKTVHNPGHIQAWRQFRSDCTIETVRLHAEAISPYIGESQWITTNNQLFWNNRTDYYEMGHHLDRIGTNYYPPMGANGLELEFGLAAARSYGNGSFQVHELRNGAHAIPGSKFNTPVPGELERLTMHTIAHGANAVFYFPWKAFTYGPEQNHGAIMGADGRPTRLFEECRNIGEKLKRLSPLLKETLPRSEAAVLYDFRSRWTLEVDSAWVGDPTLYIRQCKAMYHAMRRCGINCDVVNAYGDFSRYSVIAVPMLAIVDDVIVGQLRHFAEQGGTIVFQPLCGVKNREAEYYASRLHPNMEQLMGVTFGDIATGGNDEPAIFEWNGRRYTAKLYFELCRPQTAEVAAVYADSWFSGLPAVLENRVGRGKAVTVTSFADPDFYADLFDKLLADCNTKRLLSESVPDTVEVVERTSVDGGSYLFLLNYGKQTESVAIAGEMEDIWNRETVSDKVRIIPQGVRILTRKGNT